MGLPLLTGYFCQVGYVCRDLEAAVEAFRAKAGVRNWQVTHLPKGSLVDGMAFAYVKGVMWELIAVDPQNVLPVYSQHIPDAPDKARFHHLGYMFDTEDEYNGRIAQSQADGFPEAFSLDFGGMLAYYADSFAQLGHYTEYIHGRAEAREFFAHVPHN
jgi:hypothetical protein